MTRVCKNGREYTIKDSDVDSYLSQGYSVIDARGNVLKLGAGTDYGKLVIENGELKAALSRLESSNAALAVENANLSAKVDTLTQTLADKENALTEAEEAIRLLSAPDSKDKKAAKKKEE